MHEPQLSVWLFWAILLSSAALVAAIAHYFVKSTVAANFTSAVLVVLALAIIDTVRLGYFDGWLVVAAPIAALIAWVVSLLIGVLLDRVGVSRRVRTHGA
jgi:hypothetical protein